MRRSVALRYAADKVPALQLLMLPVQPGAMPSEALYPCRPGRLLFKMGLQERCTYYSHAHLVEEILHGCAVGNVCQPPGRLRRCRRRRGVPPQRPPTGAQPGLHPKELRRFSQQFSARRRRRGC